MKTRQQCLCGGVQFLSLFSIARARRCLEDWVTDDSKGPSSSRQLLVDVSMIIQGDARTGIQRVVRALLLQLLKHELAGYTVRPVYAGRKHGYRYASTSFGKAAIEPAETITAQPVEVRAGDIFLGLDLTAHLMPRYQSELAQWKLAGAAIYIVVYDLLPVRYPQWFKPRTTRNFQRWLKVVALYANGIICISKTVKEDLFYWFENTYRISRHSLHVNTIPMGADFGSTQPTYGLPQNSGDLVATIRSQPTALMVGTLEPRKGHAQILEAFNTLWADGREYNFVIVGKSGWHTEVLQQALKNHPENGLRLHWLDNASDEYLELLYDTSTGVILASEAEGYGLPLIEASRHNKPVLARDIPVFREIAGAGVTFFKSNEVISAVIDSWLAKPDNKEEQQLGPQLTWECSALELLRCLRIDTIKGGTGLVGPICSCTKTEV